MSVGGRAQRATSSPAQGQGGRVRGLGGVDATWQDGEDGFVIISVRSQGHAQSHLVILASNIAPDFALADQQQ